ncbi:hypothetical protein DM02DRAFT_580320 [Periconia macrospinosa]|uniref:RING-type domain-containing protein n=1 Tax=Periconia macrospinosa TaxID=97972 RepID=A0A2V1EBB3_9PLEO|nr:hypothetical protein DM02DRAFT_580320 [Periconia macrospinosa]
MSVANVEQPAPLYFQQPPSSPPFSAPQSPHELPQPHPPLASSPVPPTTQDVNMDNSSTILPPAGQPHDRDDAVMQDGLADGLEPPASNPPSGNIAVEIASVPAEEDAMDTAPDGNGIAPPGNPASTQDDAGVTQNEHATNGVTQQEPSGNDSQPPAPTSDAVCTNWSHAPSLKPPTENDPSAQPPATDPSIEHPPPPPPAEPVRSDSESSDEDDDGQPWHPIQEDLSSPDEDELKEIESTTEYSALDHEHWEKKAFSPLEEPEYSAGESGRIEWKIDAYNGTRENPNRDLVMKSKPVNIGGYDWQIKFYPKGNDSEYLSVYVECLSVEANESQNDAEEDNNPSSPEDVMVTGDGPVSREKAPSMPSEKEPDELQHTPIPLLGSQKIVKRKSVAAQVSVVLYNPNEPRVNVARTCLHRFCSASPDWGWTRFHGPYYDIPNRVRGQRQALLRDDKLAFTGYIRIVNDETNCLWEHPSSDNVWDSLAMTGLHSLTLKTSSFSSSSLPGGNIISAVAPWMLSKPFRQLLYKFTTNGSENFSTRPRPLIAAFQKVLYRIRTQVQPGTGSVPLDPIIDALAWYGIHNRLAKLDVIAVWEYLRNKLEDELFDTPLSNALEDLFGPKRDYNTGIPNYRVGVLGVESMQKAIDQSPELTLPTSPPPKLLKVELERQFFDTGSRSYVKLLNKVTLDDHINVRNTAYTLFGFVVHKQTLQSYLYQPIMRPGGPGTKWYSYSDSRDDHMVKCLTQRQAVTLHEGKEGSGRVTGNDSIAYVVMYIRDDIKASAFSQDSEQWDIPLHITNEYGVRPNGNESNVTPEQNQQQADKEDGTEATSAQDIPTPEERQFQIISSKAFLEHEGPGFVDVYGSNHDLAHSNPPQYIQLMATDGYRDIREKIAGLVGGVDDLRQVKFWFLDTNHGFFGQPQLLSTGKIEFSSGIYDYAVEQIKDEKLEEHSLYWNSRRIWFHVVDVADLPELPKEVPKVEPEPPSESVVVAPVDTENSAIPSEQPPATDAPQVEDTPMSEPDEPEPEQPQRTPLEVSDPIVPNTGDTAMVGADAPAPPDPAATEAAPLADGSADTEMGGTQENTDVPSNETANIPPEPAPVPTEEPAQNSEPPVERSQTPPPPPDELYFFVKFFDAEKQLLVPKGSFIAHRTDKLESTIVKRLELPSDQKLELYEETKLTQVSPLKGHRSFYTNDLINSALIIYTYPLTAEQREALADRAAFADLQAYLTFRAKARNFPHMLNGHFTHNYFSSQYYKGEFKNGHRHGKGYRIYHSGATYEGHFRLSQRHGEHGRYTYQNGDIYDGQWVANQQHGTGTFTEAATGNTYMGGWKNDKKFGEGVTHWKNAQETERLCRICWEESAEAAFNDCGHVVACLPCARQVENCPVCRRRVLSAMKLYYVA